MALAALARALAALARALAATEVVSRSFLCAGGALGMDQMKGVCWFATVECR